MFVVINRLTVKEGQGEELVARFMRSYGLEETPGFICFRVLEPTWTPDERSGEEWLSMTCWESREESEAWRDSDAFKKAHAGWITSSFAGRPEVTGYTPRVERPAGNASTGRDVRSEGKGGTSTHPGVMKMLLLIIMMLEMFASGGCDQSSATDRETQRPDGSIRLTDDAGRKIALDEPAERIVAGASFAVELLMALDHPPVLRPDVPERNIHPEAARSIPTFPIQHGTGPDTEAIAAARPDLVILHVNFAPFAENISRTLGVPVALLEVRSLDDVAVKLELLGRITESQEQAAQQMATLQESVQRVVGEHPEAQPRTLALFGTPEAFYAFRGRSYLGSMVKALGGVNVAADLAPDGETGGGTRSLAPINLERAIARNAEVILIVPHGPRDAVKTHMSQHPAWSQMPAVKSRRVHVLDEVLFSSSPGPRAPEALERLRDLLHPESP